MITGLTRRPHPGLVCVCGHLDGEHNLSTDGEKRTRCDTGTAHGQCGCRLFVLAVRRYVVVGFEDEPAS